MHDLDQLPLPSRDLIDANQYRNAWKSAHGYFSLNIVASRGCPYRCNWCAKPIYGDSFSVRSAALVAEEMRQLKYDFGAESICGLRTTFLDCGRSGFANSRSRSLATARRRHSFFKMQIPSRFVDSLEIT